MVKAGALIVFALVCGGAARQDRPAHDLDVPYVPTPPKVVDAMLKMAQVTSNDVVYDLGCGDGRIVVTAAEKYGARGVGVDLDPRRIAEANENAKLAHVTDKVTFVVQDVFNTDFSDATVVTLYMLPSVNEKLMPKIKALKPGTRVVTHAFTFGDAWPYERKEDVDGKTIYFWTVR
ncbi:MAG TPA: class I SAM-dependent methyltransferase [Vicinamibacterales bacterium]|jgi:cyclopropane fatty-acyl-phospholipid synthase-like methyltransferase|nr:class I SAM-dependent methyltransferase [Vicinamibacterales bacterium]